MTKPVTSGASDPMAALATAQRAFDAAKAAAASSKEFLLHGWSPELVKFLALCLLGFTLLAIAIAAVLLWRSRATAYHVLRTIGVISILGISSVLVIVGYSTEQLTPIVGLFGAVAGYLLGKDTAGPPVGRDQTKTTSLRGGRHH